MASSSFQTDAPPTPSESVEPLTQQPFLSARNDGSSTTDALPSSSAAAAAAITATGGSSGVRSTAALSETRNLLHAFDHKKWLGRALEALSVAVVAQDLYTKTHSMVSFVDHMITGYRNQPPRRHRQYRRQNTHWTVSVLVSIARMAAWFVILYRNTRFGDAVDVGMQLLRLVIAALRGPPDGERSMEGLLLGDQK